MTTAQLQKIKAQFDSNYAESRFGVLPGNSFPNLDELAHDQAIHLNNVGFGFVDIRGFSKWSEANNSQTAFRVIEPSLKAFTRVVRLHKGFIEKQTGDGLMFIMGSDKSDPRAAALCTIQCGIDLLVVGDQVVRPFMQSRDHMDDMKFGVGLAMGEALIAKVGIRGHYMLTSISKAANYAAKLEDKAIRNEILLNETLHAAVCNVVMEKHFKKRGVLLDKPYYTLEPSIREILDFCDCFKLSLV